MGILRLLLMCSFILAASGLSPLFKDEDILTDRNLDTRYRLDPNFRPGHYDVHLAPNMETFKFSGSVTIAFRVLTPATNITLHSKYLTIKNTTMDGNILPAPTVDETYDFIIYPNLNINNTAEHRIIIDFEGTLQDDMTGFYRSFYYENGTKVWLATTQFQPVHARKAFPCFDEPSFKATFSISMTCPNTYRCDSNMPGLSAGAAVNFQRTPIMSTYLLAFIVSKFEVINGTQPTNLRRFNVLARPEAEGMGDYAFTMAENLTRYMDDYFGLDYFAMNNGTPNMKVDQAAIPDFSAGAMENWGLITYREALLMYHPNESTVMSKQRIATVISHELAHMWFGNYITCHWWSDTWLNEAFARFYEFFATEEIESFGLEDQFIIAQIQASMIVDTSANSHPLSNPNTNSPAEVGNQFSTITYNKGASILRMMEILMGKTQYEAGLRSLIREKQMSTYTPDDLYRNLNANFNSTTSGLTISQIMSPWITQAGYPLLTITLNRQTGLVNLVQKRFGRNNSNSPFLYQIPITYSTQSGNNTMPRVIMRGQMETFNIPANTQGYVVFNHQQMGYFRILYGAGLRNELITALNGAQRTNIHRYNRAQFVDDAFNLAREDEIPYREMFEMIKFLEHEDEYAPWAAAIAGFNYMRLHFGKIPRVSTVLDGYIFRLLQRVVRELGMEERGDNLERVFRSAVMTLACNMGHSDCVSRSTMLFNQLKNNQPVPANLRQFVYCTALRHGNGSDYDFLWDKHQSENVVNEQVLILGALGCTRDRNRIYEYLSKVLFVDSYIRAQDRMAAVNSILNGNPSNIDHVIEFIRRNLKPMRAVMGSGMNTIYANIFTRSNPSQISGFESFLNSTDYLTQSERDSVRTSAANARETIRWADTKADDIVDWINRNSSNSIVASITLLIAMLFAVLLRN